MATRFYISWVKMNHFQACFPQKSVEIHTKSLFFIFFAVKAGASDRPYILLPIIPLHVSVSWLFLASIFHPLYIIQPAWGECCVLPRYPARKKLENELANKKRQPHQVPDFVFKDKDAPQTSLTNRPANRPAAVTRCLIVRWLYSERSHYFTESRGRLFMFYVRVVFIQQEKVISNP